LRPTEKTTPDAWARTNRTYPATAGVPGPRDPFLTPYMVPVARAVAARRHKRVVAVTAAQSGKTDTVLDVIGHRLDQAPVPILSVGPTQQFNREQFEPRITGLLDEAPSLTKKVARGKRSTKTRKVIAGVPLRLAHGGSSTALKSDPAGLAISDEVDELMANVKGQGSPVLLVDKRGETYADFTHFMTSTPSEGVAETEVDTASGLEFWKEIEAEDLGSTIWSFWQRGSRHHFAWPCPNCERFFIPRFKCLVIPEGATAAEARAKSHLLCPRPDCGGVIENSDKEWMNGRGVFVAPGQWVEPDGTVMGDPPETETISFWTSGLCSPFKTFGDRAADYVEALRSGDPEQLRVAINGGFGELWSPTGGDVPAWEAVARLRRPYRSRELPDEVLLLTAGVDVQKRSLVYSIRGWGGGASSWLIEAGELWGETDQDEVWTRLATLLTQPIGGLYLRQAFVDAGFRPDKSDQGSEHRVYAFCRRFPRLVYPTKGYATQPSPVMKSRIEVTAEGGKATYGLDLFRLHTDHWKSWVHSRLIWPEDQPGAFFLHEEATEDYCRQLVSEARTKSPTGKPVWVRKSRNNHFLDCEAMNAAAGFMLGVHRFPAGTLRAREPEPEVVVIEPASPPGEAPTSPPAPPAPTPALSIRDRFARRSSTFNR
jgi:phage terminase large subunit GpA-like protein